MTTDDLRAAYPGAADAVELHEQWQMGLMWASARAQGQTPAAIVRMMLELMGDTVTGDAWVTPGVPLRPQLEHPDFARYVAAKLGSF